MFDVAIIGTGPAGISAALTLKQLNKSFIWFGSKSLSFKIRTVECVTNYPGLISISGAEMQDVFLRQIKDAGIEITEKQVTGVYQMTGSYSILCGQEMFEAKSVILTVGVESVKPIKGELEFLGMGVSYCATCDGMLYKNKEMTVVSLSKEFEEEIEFLSEIAAKVNLIPLYKDPKTDRDTCAGFKKSQKGCCVVFKDETGEYQYTDEHDWLRASNSYIQELRPIFKNGELLVDESLNDIRQRLNENKF